MTRGASLRVGLVGLGPWGRRLLEKCAPMDGIEVVGIADPDSNALAEIRDTPCFSGLADLVARAAPDAILVAVSPSRQGEVALEALELGVATFVEKPMAMEAGVARRIARLAAEKGIVVGVGHVVRYEAAFEVASAWVREGKIGPLRSIEGTRFGARVRPDATPLWVLGPHEISRIFALANGETRIVSSRVTATEAHVAFVRGGVMCEMNVGTESPKRRLLELVGTRGKVSVDEGSGRATLETDDGVEECFEGKTDALREELREFFRAVRFGTPLRTDAAEGALVVEALEAFERFDARSRSLLEAESHALARVE